jgi:hypothetical protein
MGTLPYRKVKVKDNRQRIELYEIIEYNTILKHCELVIDLEIRFI